MHARIELFGACTGSPCVQIAHESISALDVLAEPEDVRAAIGRWYARMPSNAPTP